MASRPSYPAESRPSPALAQRRQAAIGLALAAAILAAWLAVHVYAMFFFDLTWDALPLALIPALLLAAVQCWLSVGLFIISHDAMHGSLVPGAKRINSAIGAGLLFLYAGFSWRRMRSAHFDHHRLAGQPGDPDFDEGNPSHFWRWYGTFLKRYFGWQSTLFVFSVVLFYWLALGVPVQNIVLLYGLPAIASSVQLFYFGTYRPHRHDGQGFADRHNARSESFGSLASLASCFHFGYHHEHHRRADTPWWALPRMRREILRKGG